MTDKIGKGITRLFLIFEIAGLIIYPIAYTMSAILIIAIMGRYSAICALLDLPEWFVALALVAFASIGFAPYNFRTRWRRIKTDIASLKSTPDQADTNPERLESFLPPRA